MSKRMTWEEIQEKYPDQWVGLKNVKYENDDGVTIESAVVEYIDKSKNDLVRMSIRKETVARHTTPDDRLQIGVLG